MLTINYLYLANFIAKNKRQNMRTLLEITLNLMYILEAKFHRGTLKLNKFALNLIWIYLQYVH